LSGSIGVIYPTFNEYAESFLQNEDVRLAAYTPENFRYNKDDLIAFSAECDALVLINPDNPSGHYICRDDVLAVAAHLGAHHKLLVLDESFVDFADAEDDPTLLKQDILDAYPNLIVIKSLSKSYGIPGIRLGVLACSNKKIIDGVRKIISIWNINSFAEYFLQIIGKYQKDYKIACKKIMDERARFKAELEKTGFFDVYPSQANYFLCCIKNSTSARSLAENFLKERNIFIKDLTGKKGIPSGSFVRLAVRDRNDNDAFIACLKRYMRDIVPPPQPPLY
jgi:histidinol-phosphate/aromatic aminotransferase/cobyric acid decarboxylase-like protein